MSTQRSAADAALVDLFDEFDDLEELDVDLMVEALGLVGAVRRRRRR
jgi:hypothetical protein